MVVERWRVRSTPFARSEPGGLGLHARRVEAHILAPREPGRAGRATVDTGRPHRIVETAVCVPIATDDRRPAVLIVKMRCDVAPFRVTTRAIMRSRLNSYGCPPWSRRRRCPCPTRHCPLRRWRPAECSCFIRLYEWIGPLGGIESQRRASVTRSATAPHASHPGNFPVRFDSNKRGVGHFLSVCKVETWLYVGNTPL